MNKQLSLFKKVKVEWENGDTTYETVLSENEYHYYFDHAESGRFWAEKFKCSTADDLRKKLEEVKQDNKSAWNSYGSELCAGSMFDEEDEIKYQIDKLES